MTQTTRAATGFNTQRAGLFPLPTGIQIQSAAAVCMGGSTVLVMSAQPHSCTRKMRPKNENARRYERRAFSSAATFGQKAVPNLAPDLIAIKRKQRFYLTSGYHPDIPWLMKKPQFSPVRFRLMTETLKLDSYAIAAALNVSLPTVSRIRMGHQAPSGSTAKLIQVLWPQWWPFLTEQSNQLPEG